MKQFPQTERFGLAIVALAAVAGPALASGHYWGAREWHHHYDRWHQERWHNRRWNRSGESGPVHPFSQALPNPRLTPGALNPAVTQATIHSTICVRGYTRTIRPPERYTERLKRRQIRLYGYRDRKLWHYELDHLCPLEVGGNPTSPKNLWPEPHNVAGGWGSHTKDQLENRLNHMVCRGEISLVRAQRMITTNWVAAYKRLISPTPLKHDPADRY